MRVNFTTDEGLHKLKRRERISETLLDKAGTYGTLYLYLEIHILRVFLQ